MVSIPETRERAEGSGFGFGFRGGQLELVAIALASFVAVVLALAWIQPSMRAAVWSGIAFPAGVLVGQMLPAVFARIAATPVIVFALTASTANAATQLFPHPSPAPAVVGDDHHSPADDSHVIVTPNEADAAVAITTIDAAAPATPCVPGTNVDRDHAIVLAPTESTPAHADGALCGPDEDRYYRIDLGAQPEIIINGTSQRLSDRFIPNSMRALVEDRSGAVVGQNSAESILLVGFNVTQGGVTPAGPYFRYGRGSYYLHLTSPEARSFDLTVQIAHGSPPHLDPVPRPVPSPP